MRNGMIFQTKESGEIKVIDYANSKSVLVRFINTGFEIRSTWSNVKAGKVKDKLKSSVCGVGFIGVGSFKSHKNGRMTKEYMSWSAMIGRCYGESRRDAYKDCIVCEEWHNFQAFAEWFTLNYKPNCELDKDILSEGKTGKIYSPLTCSFVSHEENVIQACAKKYKFKNKNGDIFEFSNLSDFCRRNKLSISGMNMAWSGKTTRHKDWIPCK